MADLCFCFCFVLFCFFFNDTATTEIYTLSLHDALPICWIELSDEFYRSLTSHPVPVDLRALRALKESSLALDLYAWSTWRTWRVTQKDKPVFIPWRALHRQFGSSYTDVRDFARAAKREFAKIQLVYPALRISFPRGGLTLLPSAPSVLPLFK